MDKKILPFVVVALVVGVAIGWFAGRSMLERDWENPLSAISQAEEAHASAGNADPTPKAGTKILPALPLRRARERVAKMVEKDPVVMSIGTIGSDNEASDLHMEILNRGDCEVSAYHGVAYTFDAEGKATKANKNGETYLAFSAEKQKIAKGEKVEFSAPAHFADIASLVVAHVDSVECTNGTKWTRQ